MKKKGGLADSPIFSPLNDNWIDKSDAGHSDPKLTQPTKSKIFGKRSNGQANERSDEQANGRSSVQMVNRSDEQDYRVIVRHTYDFYQDQVYSIEDEVLYRGRQTGKSITKGELVREIVDFYFKKKKR